MTTDPTASPAWRETAARARAWAENDTAQPDAHDVAFATSPPPWLTSFLDAHNASIRKGQAMVCRHVGPEPIVAHVAVWRPGAVCCTSCYEAGALYELANVEQLFTCYVCGRPGDPTTLCNGNVQGGVFIVHFSIHRDCPWTPPTQPAP